MKANELRIGNLVNIITREGEIHLPNRKVFSVQEIGFDCVLCDINKIPAQEKTLPVFAVRDLASIPLTAEWLEKLGFRTSGPKLLFLPIPKHGMEIHYEMKPYGNVVTLQSDFGMLIPNDVQYIHQLQNLLFALTGEELTIKEE